MATYKANAKNAEMFGDEKKGYSKERVDSYITRLEEIYQKATDAIIELKDAVQEKDEIIAQLSNTVDTLKNEIDNIKKREENAQETNKDLLAKVLIDAREAAEKTVKEAEEQAAAVKINSQVQISLLEKRKDALINDINEITKRCLQAVDDIENGSVSE